MNTLDLFLKNAGGEHVEAVHQRILWWLFHSKTIIQEIFGDNIQTPKVTMEAHGKLFDLQINDGETEKVLIEIKMWSSFGKTQISDQTKHINKKPKVTLAYILFGISYLEKKDFLKNFKHPNLKSEDPIIVIGADDLSKSLLKLSNKTNSFFEELNSKETGECTSIELKQFLTTYALRISRTNDWFINEAYKEDFSSFTKTHYASLLNQVKNCLQNKEKAYQSSIHRNSRSDVKLEITCSEVQLTQEGDKKIHYNREVQIEKQNFQLLFWIQNKSIQIVAYFSSKEPPVEWKQKARTKILEFNELKNAGTNLGKTDSTNKVIVLWSKTIENNIPEKIANEIGNWYPTYVSIYNKYSTKKS